MMTKRALGFVVLAVLAAVGSAQAAPINCPGTPSPLDREFTVNTAPNSTCLAFGVGNISGNNDAINLLGFITLDKTDDGTTGGAFQGSLNLFPSGTSGLSGIFTIDPNVWDNFSEVVIAFKSGQGQLDPDWAAFVLPTNTVFGFWAISGQQQLSHANLYGRGEPGPTPIPEPGTLMLVAAGSAILARRRRHLRK